NARLFPRVFTLEMQTTNSRRHSMKLTKLFSLGFAALFTLAQIAKSGPPLICHALNIGGAKSLPWSNDVWSLSGKTDYDLSRLVADTLELLAPSTPAIVRMETIRRATLYAQKDQRIAKELLLKLRSRALDSEAKEPALSEAKRRADALAWFDLGYLVEGWEAVVNSNPASGLDGYAWVEKAISLRGPDPEMEFAAALISLEGHHAGHQEHVEKAVAGAKGDSLLATNLATHFSGDKGDTIGAMLGKVATAKN
ncbi:MAG: hypothetical protein DMG25_08415, partial [Acidobacteria bacterium]